MEQLIINEETIRNATDYIPLAVKQASAKLIAENCIEEVKLSALQAQADETLALPARYEENWMSKKLYLAQYFLSQYLHIELPNDFGCTDYDKLFSSHPFEQIERLKFTKDIEVRNKVYDILADYGELKKLTEVEIYNAKAVRNDPLDRLLASMTVFAKPETVQKILEMLKESAEELENKSNQNV